MDNAIRFDDARMVKNSDTAWSFDQESVDLNAFLAYEYKLLKKLANVSGQAFDEKDRTDSIRTYFYDEDAGFFFDRRMDGTFVKVAGSEAYSSLDRYCYGSANEWCHETIGGHNEIFNIYSFSYRGCR